MQSAETRQALEEYLLPLVADGVDTLILGCTHYPFLTDQIRAIVGEDVRLVDPALATAAELQESLVESGLANNHTKGPDRLTTSGDPASFQRLGERLLARRLPACRKVQVTVDAGVSVG
jgi:glutamate racemase